MCRKTQILRIILLSFGAGLILSSFFEGAILRIILGVIALLAGLAAIK